MFNMIKTLKRWGNNLVVVFTKEEEQMFGMIENDKLDLSDLFLIETKYKPLPKESRLIKIKKEVLK